MRNLLHGFTKTDWLLAVLVGVVAALIPVAVNYGLALGYFEPAAASQSDRLFLLFLCALLGVLGLAVCLGVLARVKMDNRVYRTFARQVGGTVVREHVGILRWLWWSFSPPKAIAFSHAGAAVHLARRTETRPKEEARMHPSYCVQMTAALPFDPAFYCNVSTLAVAASAGKRAPKRQDLELGWDLFDVSFGVETNDEAKAREVLSREVQEELVRLNAWAQHETRSNDVEMTIENASLRVAAHALLWQTDELTAFCQFGIRLYDLVGSPVPLTKDPPPATAERPENNEREQ